MKKVLLKSLDDAYEYVMEHYSPFGLEEYVERKDTYAVISIQDSPMGGFGIRFCENRYCKGALTLLFDDVWKDVKGAVSFNEDMARQIIEFIEAHRDADSLLVHCYAGKSRSRAVAAFAVKMLGGNNDELLNSGSPNKMVYDTLMSVYRKEYT